MRRPCERGGRALHADRALTSLQAPVPDVHPLRAVRGGGGGGQAGGRAGPRAQLAQPLEPELPAVRRPLAEHAFARLEIGGASHVTLFSYRVFPDFLANASAPLELTLTGRSAGRKHRGVSSGSRHYAAVCCPGPWSPRALDRGLVSPQAVHAAGPSCRSTAHSHPWQPLLALPASPPQQPPQPVQ